MSDAPAFIHKSKGKVRVREIREGGKVRGFQIDKNDGRVAAVVRPDPLKLRISVSGKEE